MFVVLMVELILEFLVGYGFEICCEVIKWLRNKINFKNEIKWIERIIKMIIYIFKMLFFCKLIFFKFIFLLIYIDRKVFVNI